MEIKKRNNLIEEKKMDDINNNPIIFKNVDERNLKSHNFKFVSYKILR